MARRALNVAEKPSVAKELANILSGGRANSRRGVSTYNTVYEFDGRLDGGPCKMTVTSVLGHLMEMDFEEQYRAWRGVDIGTLFDAPIKIATRKDEGGNSNNEAVRKNLEQAVRGCTDLILWLDCDREGEAIGFEVMEACAKAQRNLRVRRARFSALIPRDIQYALDHLVQPDSKQSDAVLARSEIDLRLGAAFTRLQTLTLQNRFDGLGEDGPLSYGPCQFPTMWFVARRADRIAAFSAEQFWQIEMAHTRAADDGESLCVSFSWKRYRLFDRLATLVLYEMCADRRIACVTSVTAKPTTKRRPSPLATVEMQRDASRLLRISSDQCMSLAESLYQRGYLSYPRTETDGFKEGFDLRTLIEAQRQSGLWGSYAQRLLDGDFLWPRPGGKDDNAHPPIHPVKGGHDLSDPNEVKLYELIARRFLACCSRDALGHETVVKVELAGEEFSATGLMVIERNYLDVYRYDKWTGRKIPTFYEGEHFVPAKLEMRSGSTEPPSPLTESDLIAEMEAHSIGTDATIAEHIKKILERNYVEKRNGSYFYPTMTGRTLLRGYVDVGFDLGKPEQRAEMERAIDRVASGQHSKAQAISTIIEMMRPLFQMAARAQHKLVAAAAHFFQPVDTRQWPQAPLSDQSQPACSL